mmetsp:Transcript_38063/g.83590  ORF Transcript_38063/g.83590 Transcript_38063/m.83590 type:complete len:238 (-) Transcript_38063:439-1152(-)
MVLGLQILPDAREHPPVRLRLMPLLLRRITNLDSAHHLGEVRRRHLLDLLPRDCLAMHDDLHKSVAADEGRLDGVEPSALLLAEALSDLYGFLVPAGLHADALDRQGLVATTKCCVKALKHSLNSLKRKLADLSVVVHGLQQFLAHIVVFEGYRVGKPRRAVARCCARERRGQRELLSLHYLLVFVGKLKLHHDGRATQNPKNIAESVDVGLLCKVRSHHDWIAARSSLLEVCGHAL